jgi:TldD protein
MAAMASVLPRRVVHKRVVRKIDLADGHVPLSEALQVRVDDPRTKELLLRAIDAAKQAGAQYADARLSYSRRRDCLDLFEEEELGIGVRSLVNGYWGFASGPVCTADGAVRVGRESALQAKVNDLGKARTVDLGMIPPVHDGNWTTPIEIDPFEVPLEEIRDWVLGLLNYANDMIRAKDPEGYASGALVIRKQQQAFVSSEGSYYTQTRYATTAAFGIAYKGLGDSVPGLGMAGKGWELMYNAPVREWLPKAMARIEADLTLPLKPLDVGRYDVAFGPVAMASILSGTIGAATQIDRAIGYEANAGGTSYLGPNPMDVLGTAIASPLITVVADRSTPAALATVQWDDEGVEPQPFTLVQDGVLVDYQTTREQAAWLAPYYQKRGIAVQSHGCANTTSALDWTMQHTPNLTLVPGKTDVDFDGIVTSLDKGVAIGGANVDMDQQHLNGLGMFGGAYEVRRGRRTARLRGGAGSFLFRAPEFWKSLSAIGGSRSVGDPMGGVSVKGEPEQTSWFTVRAVPALAHNIAMINITKRV